MSLRSHDKFSIAARAGLLGLGILGATVSACVSITDETSTQCRSEEDCRARGPDWADTTCTAERVCVKVPIEATNCSTNQECTDRVAGAPSRCLPTERKCVPLTSAECPRLLGAKQDILNDNTIFIGASWLANLDGIPIENAIELAQLQFMNQSGRGLRAIEPGGPKRPIVVISCNAEVTPVVPSTLAGATRSLRHLANAGVPVVIGPFQPLVVSTSVSQALLPAKVATLITGTGPRTLTTTPDEVPLIFRMGASDDMSAFLAPQLMTEVLEKRAYDDLIAPVGEPLRVQLIHEQGVAPLQAAEYIKQNLKFNGGKSTVDNGANFHITTLPASDPIYNPNSQAAIPGAVSDAIAYKPHILFFSMGPTTGTQTMTGIDTLWPAGVERPLVINAGLTWQANIITALGTRDVLRKRFYGLIATPTRYDTDRFKAFENELKLSDQGKGISGAVPIQAGHAYDAFWLAAYALQAVGASQVSGATFAQGLRKVLNTGGPDIDTGNDSIVQALTTIESGGGLNIRGVAGPIKFNDIGLRTYDARLWCVAATAGRATSIVEPGYMLDSTDGATKGSFACPP